jgi:hypothetical protein
MDDQHRLKQSRYASLLAVLALHAAVLTAFFMAAKTRLVLRESMPPLELLTLPREFTPPQSALPPTKASPDHQLRDRPAQSSLPADALTVAPITEGNAPGEAIDWAQEARDIAASIASRGTDGTPAEPRFPSAFAQPPPHHKGEQIPTADGRWKVFISDRCYQLSKEITHITNATNTGKAIQTYCEKPSKTPRGDLFKELPAYKKHHPDQ